MSGLDRPTAVRFRWANPRTALWAGIVAAVLVLAGVPLSIATHGLSANVLSLVFLPYGIVGFVIARRQPRNPIGWILLAILIAVALAGAAGQYASLHYNEGYQALPLARVGVFLAALWVFMVVLLPLPIGLFPDGRLSRPWRFDLPYGLVTSLALRIRAVVGRFEPCPVHIRPSSVPVPLRWFVPADLSVGSLSSWG